MLNRLYKCVILSIIIFFSLSGYNPLYSQNEETELYIGREIDKEPEGKEISNIIIVILPPLNKDIIPIQFVVDIGNSLHINTKKSVIEQELSIKEGDIYNSSIINENLVYLQSYKIVASAKSYPLITDKPETVDIAIEIIDEWSLELSPNFNKFENGILIGSLKLEENNLLGLNKQLGATIGGFDKFYIKFSYEDYTLIRPVQIISFFQLNYDEFFNYEYIDIALAIKTPLVKTLRNYSFEILYHFYYGIDVSSGYNFLYPSIKNNAKNIENYQQVTSNNKNIHKFHFKYGYLFKSIIDNVIEPELFILFISDFNNNSDNNLINNIFLINKTKSSIIAPPYNYFGINLITSKTNYIEIKDYHVYNRTNIAQEGFTNEFSYKRADKLLGSPYNSNIFRNEISLLYRFLDDLLLIHTNIFYEIDINDFSEIISENIGFTQIFYVRPFDIIWGQIAGSFSLKTNIRGNGERDIIYTLGNSYSSNDSLVRGTTNTYKGLGYINLNLEYRTKGIRINRSWSLGFAVFYDLGKIYQNYNLNTIPAYPDYILNELSSYPIKHSIGISIRADYGTINQIILDFGFDLDGLPDYDKAEDFWKNLEGYLNFIFSINQVYKF